MAGVRQSSCFAALFLELRAECFPAVTQLQAAAMLRCDSRVLVCFLCFYDSPPTLKPRSDKDVLFECKSTSVVCLAVGHCICIPLVVIPWYGEAKARFCHLVLKERS